jgi:phosphoribosylformylglycinamidine cyclo-ligase
MAKSAYAKAGVDIDEMMSSIGAIKRMVKGTAVKGVMSDVGSFGGLFASPGKDHVLVASTDGVGTKLSVAHLARRHDTVGQDLVNHCVNDILVQGARPLFFLDYLGTARLRGDIFRDVVKGLCKACKQNGCALLGGETAEMPGLYPSGEYDLVGTIVGAVEKKKLITGKSIRTGDIVIGLPSSGLHTNGFSLARRIIFEKAGLKIRDRFPGTRRSVGDVLLAVHRSYLKPVTGLIDSGVKVNGMAHLTGGGFQDNIPRVLPAGLRAVVDRSSWQAPPVFRFIRERGKVSEEELHRVFNMGIGYVVIVRRKDADRAIAILKRHRCAGRVIGRIERGRRGLVWA